MAGNLINTLYPPIAETFMPAFVNTQDGYIYFSLSPYNLEDEIQKVHITLVDQKTNISVFRSIPNPEAGDPAVIGNGILIIPWNNIEYDENSGLYACKIDNKYLTYDTVEKQNEQTGEMITERVPSNFKINTYYQAQVRLDKSQENIDNVETYLYKNRQQFSEWSRVILLRPIPEPLMYFKAWDKEPPDEAFSIDAIQEIEGRDGTKRKTIVSETVPSFNVGLVPIAGQICWESASTKGTTNTEYLDNYKITIYQTGAEEPFLETDTIYVGNQEKDSIYYLADLTQARENTSFIVHIDAETRNGYQWWDERSFDITEYSKHTLDLTWDFVKVKLNSYGDNLEKIATEEDGFIKCHVTSSKNMEGPGYLYILRSSSVDGYRSTEIIQVTAQSGDTIDEWFEDRTVCSLINYRYKAQYKYKKGTWTPLDPDPIVTKPVEIYPEFYDMLILRQDKQLAIRFDDKIQSLKPVVNRVKIDTLGGKYPRFAENARMNYKQFQISGIVSAEADFNRKFMDETDETWEYNLESYDDNIGNIWQVRNDTLVESTENPVKESFHDTYLHNNWYWEREFREQATKWLNDGEPKLFRSMTEGNLLVILTDINLTPNETLGRRLYNFSATAYEIADGMNYDDLVKYGVVIRRDDEAEAMKHHDSEEGSSEDYTKIERVSQYILKEKNLEDGKEINTSLIDVVNGQILKNDLVEGWYDPITLKDFVNQQCTGVYRNKKIREHSNIRIRDLKIQFLSKPKWMERETLNFLPDQEDSYRAIDNPSDYVLGYKFQIRVNANKGNLKTIFVNPKGYYQIPAGMDVTALQFYYGEEYQLDYILSYDLEYDETTIAGKTEKVKDVIGQYSGIFYPGDYMGDAIKNKYYSIKYSEGETVASQQYLQDWRGIHFDVTPYAVLNLLEKKESNYQTRIIGQTGTYNILENIPVTNFYFSGRRMMKAPADNRPYLDEWEYVLDDSVLHDYEDVTNYWYEILGTGREVRTDDVVKIYLNSLSPEYDVWDYWGNLDGTAADDEKQYGYFLIGNIKNPQYNTIYKIVDREYKNPVYVIYYVDQGWYQVIPYDVNFNSVLAKVPIYGDVNYKGTVMKEIYS